LEKLLVKKGNFSYISINISYVNYKNVMINIKEQEDVLKKIPEMHQTHFIVLMSKNNESAFRQLNVLKNFSEDINIAKWLNINVKTFRDYTFKKNSKVKADLSEHVIMLLSLFKHGKKAFGSYEAFEAWLNKEHFTLSWEKPSEYLSTIKGIEFINNLVTGLEYGDNV